MELKDVDILPGVIVDSYDPKNKGRVKANVPTLFDPETPKEALPWIYPFNMWGYQSYSRMRDGAQIWVINNKKNYNEYWYFPFFRLNEDTQEIANQGEDVDIVFDRNDGNASRRFYTTPNDGIKGSINEFYYNLLPDGKYIVQGKSDTVIIVDKGKVFLGSNNGTETPAVRFDKLTQAIDTFCQTLGQAGQAISGAMCGAAPGGALIQQACEQLKTDIKNSKSDTVVIKG